MDRRPGLEGTTDSQQLQTQDRPTQVTHRVQADRVRCSFKELWKRRYFGLSSVELMNRRRSEAGDHLVIVSGVRGHTAELCGQLERLLSGGGASLKERR